MRDCEVFEFQWPYILSLLADSADLEASAVRTGALTRRREIRSADDLLRLAMTYSVCGLSLRQTAAYAQTLGFASISDVALLKRLRRCNTWLGELLARKLCERTNAVLSTEFRVRIVDATTVNRPGTHGTDLRLHVGMDLRLGRIDHVELTDNKGGETLTRFPVEKGDVVVADRGYLHRAGLESVHKRGAFFVVRANWQNLPLQHPDGSKFEVLPELRMLPEDTPADFPVVFLGPSAHPISARLVAIRRSEPAATRTRAKAMSEAKKKSRVPDPRTLEASGYFYVLTNLTSEQMSAEQVLELYRFRWQIEIQFKELKGLLDLNTIPAKDPALTQTWLYAKLLAALLIDDLTVRYVSFSPWGYKIRRSPRLRLETSPDPQ